MRAIELEVQKSFIANVEAELEVNAAGMAKLLRVHYKTYSKWRNSENKMDAITKTALLMLMQMKTAKEQDVHALDMWIATIEKEQINNAKGVKPLCVKYFTK